MPISILRYVDGLTTIVELVGRDVDDHTTYLKPEVGCIRTGSPRIRPSRPGDAEAVPNALLVVKPLEEEQRGYLAAARREAAKDPKVLACEVPA